METEQSEPKWKVDNWQIPVPVGDCSVHLLVDVSDPANPQIKKAFIMDGGKSAGGVTAEDQIVLALAAIDKQYSKQTDWKFDAWVVTHWDKDHYDGVLQLCKGRAIEHARGGEFMDAYFHDHPTLFCGGPKEQAEGLNIPQDFVIRGPEKNQLLGLDLFTSDRIFTAEGKPLANSKLNQPRFCVVGANGVVVSKPDDSWPKTNISKNEQSILAVVFWPGKGGKGRTSYFTGGDGNPAAEVECLAPWLNENANRNKNDVDCRLPQTPVNMLKLDHHGSSTEMFALLDESKAFPKKTRTLLEVLQPVNLLVTPGNQYGHPTWDVLYFLYDYIMERRLAPDSEKVQLVSTRSPYWFNTEGGTGLNLGHISFLNNLMEEHLKHVDKNEEKANAKETHHSMQYFLAEQKETIREAFETYQRMYEKFKDRLEIYVKKKAQTGESKIPKTKSEEKPYRYVQQEVAKNIRQMRADLHMTYKDDAGDDEEEPEMDGFRTAFIELMELQFQIRDILAPMWRAMCPQEIILCGNPFWLVRFVFDDAGTKMELLSDEGEDPKPIDKVDKTKAKEAKEELKIKDVVKLDTKKQKAAMKIELNVGHPLLLREVKELEKKKKDSRGGKETEEDDKRETRSKSALARDPKDDKGDKMTGGGGIGGRTRSQSRGGRPGSPQPRTKSEEKEKERSAKKDKLQLGP
ncbi:hypothetical protein QBC47DRAFT_438803 [Echria macrotheca]|uniref:Metallo-beta-lactamase domain-containing protein n=1 Tax=Echria macrotheca TaxID=438768 RepID=A0AAJ0F0T5_9PEZI|nr:hypothetical protein QBC47DRAFT_438803 [Echria macrotheca]